MYTFLRYGTWYFGGLRFARKASAPGVPHLHFRHRAPLLRKLKDVDMQYQDNKIVSLRLAAA